MRNSLSYAGGVTSAPLQVLPTPSGSQLVLFPNPVPGGLLALGQVFVSRPASPGGQVVALASSNPAVAIVPASVTIPAGTHTTTFPVITLRVPAATSVVITVGGLGGPTTATLQVLP